MHFQLDDYEQVSVLHDKIMRHVVVVGDGIQASWCGCCNELVKPDQRSCASCGTAFFFSAWGNRDRQPVSERNFMEQHQFEAKVQQLWPELEYLGVATDDPCDDVLYWRLSEVSE